MRGGRIRPRPWPHTVGRSVAGRERSVLSQLSLRHLLLCHVLLCHVWMRRRLLWRWLLLCRILQRCLVWRADRRRLLALSVFPVLGLAARDAIDR
jgi:hypothetical protein